MKHLSALFHATLAVITVTFLLINLLLVPIFIFILAFVRMLMPTQALRLAVFKSMDHLVLIWLDINYWILYPVMHHKWDFPKEAATLNPHHWYVMLANHNTWFDILVINCAFKRHIPSLKFFMKRELLWSLPFGGLACYLLGYPFLNRHAPAQIKKNPKLRNKDLEEIKRACGYFKKIPATSISFVEGTRFTLQKHQRQRSPYKHLLKPKAGSLAVVMNELSSYTDTLLDVTIHYSQPSSLWAILCGKIDKITVCLKQREITPALRGEYYTDREHRKEFQKWLNQIWAEKDQLLTQIAEKQNHVTEKN